LLTRGGTTFSSFIRERILEKRKGGYDWAISSLKKKHERTRKFFVAEKEGKSFFGRGRRGRKKTAHQAILRKGGKRRKGHLVLSSRKKEKGRERKSNARPEKGT